MDPHTLEILQFDQVRELLAGYASCSLGKERARSLAPTAEPREISRRQQLAAEMTEALAAGLSPPLGGLHDIRALVRRATVGAALEGEELAEVAEVLMAVADLNRWLERLVVQFPHLGALRHGIGEFGGVASSISSCLDSRGKVLDTASRKLSNLRAELAAAEARIQETLGRMLRSPEVRRILRYPNFTVVGERYVLPVAKDSRGEIAGSVLRNSASNETVFVEPQAIAELSAQLSFVRAKEHKEVRRILRWLSAQVGMVSESLLGSLETLAELDMVQATGRFSLDFAMVPPDFNDQGRLALRRARHPLLEALFRKQASALTERATENDAAAHDESARPSPRQVVPIDVVLGFRTNMLVVTGPNTGGKTVALKTVALLAMMAQSGLHIPAQRGSQLPVFDQVLADIGDEQSLEQSLSTFSSHVRRVSQILSLATERSLVVLDELGAGTDPTEGAALRRAILDELDSIGSRAMVTTHIGDLKSYALTNPRAENAAVEFDHETLQPLYHLRIGDIGQSNALQIARRLNLPGHLVDRAARYLQDSRGQEAPEWEVLRKLRKEAEEAQQSALKAEAQAAMTREALTKRLADLQKQSEQDKRVALTREQLQPGDRVVVPRLGYDRPGRIVKVDARKRKATVAIGSMQWDVTIDELVPQVLKEPEARRGAPPGGALPNLEDFSE